MPNAQGLVEHTPPVAALPPVATGPVVIPELGGWPVFAWVKPPVAWVPVPPRSDEVPQAAATPPTTRGHASRRLNDPRTTIPSSKPLRRGLGNPAIRETIKDVKPNGG